MHPVAHNGRAGKTFILVRRVMGRGQLVVRLWDWRFWERTIRECRRRLRRPPRAALCNLWKEWKLRLGDRDGRAAPSCRPA